MNTKLPMNYNFEKKNCAGLANTGGAAGEWLITDEFSTDLDKMGIFVFSKDQTFRICATFLDPAKFFILVIHLFTRGMLDFGSLKLRLWLIGLMEFNFLKTQTYLHEICQLSLIHLKIGGANFMG
jgi:hypothetical protein